MNININLESFLEQNGISNEKWEKSKCDWDELLKIAEDHESRLSHLRDTAEFFARVVQKLPNVHSVRWRVKDTAHLLEKIIRKRADEDNEKYLSIDRKNYFEIVTDLVGLRALHLFKEDCFCIDEGIRTHWTPIEKPIAYVRDGDHADLSSQFEAKGFDVKTHRAGYRSVHYVFSSQPLQRQVVVEVQVRTIFEEGWSEIDHRVRYPNFSDNALVAYFLKIFNRLAGSADEMGGFVKGLAHTLKDMQYQIREANDEKEKTLRAMEQTLEELDSLRQQDLDSRASITKLKSEISQLRKASDLESILSTTSPRGLLDLDRSVDSEYFKRTIGQVDAALQYKVLDHLFGTAASSGEIQKGLIGLAHLPKKP